MEGVDGPRSPRVVVDGDGDGVGRPTAIDDGASTPGRRRRDAADACAVVVVRVPRRRRDAAGRDADGAESPAAADAAATAVRGGLGPVRPGPAARDECERDERRRRRRRWSSSSGLRTTQGRDRSFRRMKAISHVVCGWVACGSMVRYGEGLMAMSCRRLLLEDSCVALLRRCFEKVMTREGGRADAALW